MKKKTNRTTSFLLGALTLLVGLLVAAGIIMQLSGQAARDNIERANAFLLKERTVYGLMIDMETGERGYIITGDETFLEPYNKAKAALPALWEELATIAADLDRRSNTGPTRVAELVAEMRARAEEWERETAEPEIALRRAGRVQELSDIVASGTGRARFDAFREASSRVTERTNGLLNEYNRVAQNVSALDLSLLIGLGTLALVGVIITMQVSKREAALQQKARHAAEAETARLQTIIEYLPVAVRLVDVEDGRVILQNRTASALFPLDVWNSLTPEERPAYFNYTRVDGTPLRYEDLPGRRTRREGVTITDFEFKITRPEIGTKSLLANTAPLRNESGTITGAVIVIQDVTRMREADQRKDEFIATAAHELRNPLASLSGYNQLLQRMMAQTDAPPRVVSHLEQMGKQIKRINNLVEHLLDASRIQLGRLILNRSRSDLIEIAKTAITDAQATDAGAHQIVLVAPGGEIVGEWDATRLEQVMTNLVGNALTYSPAGTQVEVRVSTCGSDARVEVADQGPGVPPEQRLRLFELYYQSQSLDPADYDARLRKGRGLGLGLHISSEIVKAHGGQIGMEPNPGGGSIFWFTLPGVSTQQ
ncbi:MAG TPA: ATP-binding protein [Chloroflexia bacterium]|nr:ATP-binding protein [Chloroflexia bacterium]